MDTTTHTTTHPLSTADENLYTTPTATPPETPTATATPAATPTPTPTPETPTTAPAPATTTTWAPPPPSLCNNGQQFALIFSVLIILFGAFVQYLSFPEIKWQKAKNIDWSTPFMIFMGLMANMGGTLLFGRPHWPLIIQFVCLACSVFIMIKMAELAAWWERMTMLLMLCGMIGEFLYRRRRGGES